MSGLRRWLDRLVDPGLPKDFAGRLVDEERVLGVAEIAGDGHLVATSLGLWLPEGEGARRVGWHLISKAVWSANQFEIVEADETDTVSDAVLLADRPPRRVRVTDPGRVPEVVHARVTGSIRSSHHRDLPGGGAWVVQRSVAGRDGYVLQVRPDPGTDRDAVRSLAAQVADRVRDVRREG